ncbi:MAG: tyrosine-type recombinase/integrase [Streptococcus salivarius]|nr:tyrosine-type recombinase/integrase [Streptococcus salivarius]
MAKGSVRKKGKKWYYRFYVEDASGNLVQKECVGTESKSETEKLLRQAMDDYEKKKFVAKADNLTVGQLLDVWAEEELKTGTLSNGTVENYLGTIRNIKKHPLAERKLKNVTSEHLQSFFDLLSFGGVHPDGKERKGYSKDYIHSFSAVMQQSFRFAVFPKQYITFNPMQYIKLRYQTDEVDLFSDEDMDGNIQPISREDYERLLAYLKKKNPAAILPIQIAYYAGLRIGEACGLAWQDVNLEEQCLTIRRSIRYDGSKRKDIIGPTKRKKVRIVDFGDTLVEIFRNARKEQLKNRMQYGELYHTNYYKAVKEKNRVYYEYYCLDRTEEVPADYKEISFVCLRPDGCLELPTTLGTVCRKVAKTLEGFEGFHFHQLRHTYTSNLLANGAAPKDVQELLGHSDVSTTMNVYAHSTRDAKRKSVRLLDKVVGND